MEEDDKGCPMIRLGVSGWVFLLVPAYPCCPGQKPLNGCVCVCVNDAFYNGIQKSAVNGDLHIFKVPDWCCRCENIQQTDDLPSQTYINTLVSTYSAHQSYYCFTMSKNTKSSTTIDWPNDAMCQPKSCQQLHNSAGLHNKPRTNQSKLECYSQSTYTKLCASSHDMDHHHRPV